MNIFPSADVRRRTRRTGGAILAAALAFAVMPALAAYAAEIRHSISGSSTLDGVMVHTDTGAPPGFPEPPGCPFDRDFTDAQGEWTSSLTLVGACMRTTVWFVDFEGRYVTKFEEPDPFEYFDQPHHFSLSSSGPLTTNTVAPSIVGTPTVGNTLSINAGTWAPADDGIDTLATAVSWFANGERICEACYQGFLTLTDEHVGKVITATVKRAALGYRTGHANTAPVVVGESININDVTVAEGDSGTKNATFTVSLSEPQSSAVSVKYATANGTATAPADYTAKTATLLSFAAGQTSKTVTIPVKGDLVAEDDETFSVVLSNAVGLPIGDGTGTGTITDDETATPHVSVGDVSVTEGNSGVKNAVFTVNLTNAAKSNVSVKYATANGTATAPTDYTAKTPTALYFSAGQTSKTVSVALKPDVLGEADETFNLVLSAPTGMVIDDGSATATIVNDDAPAPAASVADVSIAEGAKFGTKNLVFTVQLSAPAQGAISLKYKTVNGTATAPSDFTAKALTALSFSAGQTSKTVTIQVKGDADVEPDEDFQLLLSDASAGLTIADPTATGTITNDD